MRIFGLVSLVPALSPGRLRQTQQDNLCSHDAAIRRPHNDLNEP